MDTRHQFSSLDIKQAKHEFAQMMIRYFGEIWSPKSDARYKGKEWICRSMVSLDGGLWRLCQEAKHADAERVFGMVEPVDSGYALRIVIFYTKKEGLIV